VVSISRGAGYSLTGRYLIAATMQARLAGEIEAKSSETVTDNDKLSHFGFVTASIMQSIAAFEV
jgi:hypothetical protein